MNPRARKDDLITQDVDGETLVYDEKTNATCCLNPLASAVWALSDGGRSVGEIAAALENEIELPADIDAEEVVAQALLELHGHDLMLANTSSDGADARPPVGRRKMLKAAAVAALFPAIRSIVAPSLAMAQSPAPTPTPTTSMMATPTVTPTPSTSMMATPTVTPTASTPSVSPSATPTATPTVTPTVTPTTP